MPSDSDTKVTPTGLKFVQQQDPVQQGQVT